MKSNAPRSHALYRVLVHYALLIGCVSVLSSGCFVHHLDRNAPGIDDIREQPQGLSPGELQPPADPGERMVSLLTGPFFLVGGARPGDFNSWRGVQQLGLEATVSYSTHDTSHSHGPDAHGLFSEENSKLVLRSFSPGLNLGWIPLHWGGGERDGHQFYLEAQIRSPIPVVAAGWAVQPAVGQHGPQVTVSLAGMNWFRVNYFTNGDFALFYGVTLKVGNIWVWSQ